MLEILKDKWRRFKYLILSLLAIPVALALVPLDIPLGATKVIELDWMQYQTIEFGTVNGELGEGEWAEDIFYETLTETSYATTSIKATTTFSGSMSIVRVITTPFLRQTSATSTLSDITIDNGDGTQTQTIVKQYTVERHASSATRMKWVHLAGEKIRKVEQDFYTSGLTERTLKGWKFVQEYKDSDIKAIYSTETITREKYYEQFNFEKQPEQKTVEKTAWIRVKEAFAGIAGYVQGSQSNLLVASVSAGFGSAGMQNQSDKMLVVHIGMVDATDADRTVTAMTSDGLNMTSVREDDNNTDDNSLSTWYIQNPILTSDNVSISVTLNGTNTEVISQMTLYTGGSQTGAVDANTGQTKSDDNTIFTSITPVASGIWIFDGVIAEDALGGDPEAGTNQVGWGDAVGTNARVFNSDKGPISPAASTSMSWNYTPGVGAADWSHSLFSFPPESEQPAESSTWWDTNFLYRRKITFNNAPSQQTLTNFPVNIFLSQNASDEAAPNNITYANVKAQGGDIRFVDADQTTMLKHEIEKWDTSATSTVWVKIPKLTATSTTDHIWMYYGNTATSSGAATTSVWDGHFKGVWHMTATSTAARKFINSVGTTTAGIGTNFDSDEYTTTGTKIDGALDFDGNNPNDYINNGTASMMNFSNATSRFTVSGWMKPDDFGNYNALASRWSSVNSRQFSLGSNISDGVPRLILSTSGTVATLTLAGATALSTTAWSYLAGTVDVGTDNHNLYANGVNVVTDTTAITTLFNNSSAIVSIGATKEGTDDLMDGKLDEIRISDTIRSSDWLQQEYRYGLASSTTHTYGAEENVPVVGGASQTSTSTIFKSDTIFKSNVILNFLFIQSLAYWYAKRKPWIG